MDEIQIQQRLKKLLFLKLLPVLLLTGLLSSCIQLRYTDYGRPLDFLKSKNQHYTKTIKSHDTSAIYISEYPEIKQKTKKIFSTNNLTKDSIVNKPSLKQLDIHSDNLTTQVEARHLPIEAPDQKNKLKRRKNPNILKNKTRGPGWWDNFWSGFWNFVLKWLLIFIGIFILFALVIWGIYLLIGLLAGPIAASIFLAIVIVLLYILFEFA